MKQQPGFLPAPWVCAALLYVSFCVSPKPTIVHLGTKYYLSLCLFPGLFRLG